MKQQAMLNKTLYKVYLSTFIVACCLSYGGCPASSTSEQVKKEETKPVDLATQKLIADKVFDVVNVNSKVNELDGLKQSANDVKQVISSFIYFMKNPSKTTISKNDLITVFPYKIGINGVSKVTVVEAFQIILTAFKQISTDNKVDFNNLMKSIDEKRITLTVDGEVHPITYDFE